MDQWDLHQKVIWDQDLMVLHQMVWAICILTWTMQVHTTDQDQMDRWDLQLMLIWTVMEWLRLRHPMIQLMM